MCAETIKADKKLDTSGLCCPMPMVEINRAMQDMKEGETLEIISTDTGTRFDIPSWCQRTGNELLFSSSLPSRDDGEGHDTKFRYVVRKKSHIVDWFSIVE